MSNHVKQPLDDSRQLPPWCWPRAAYVHVPFCQHRCGYCDFATVAGQDQLADRYLDALAREMSALGSPQPVDTIFIGGGTPTHLTHGQLERLLRLVRDWFTFGPEAQHVGESAALARTSPDTASSPARHSASSLLALRTRSSAPDQPRIEFTVEANPGTLDHEKVNVLADHGVNRVSLGAQSFQQPLLRVLERNHEPLDVPKALALLRPRIDNLSIDLIFGVPGQTLEQWQSDLQVALSLGTQHLSVYGLTYEKGTPLWKQRERGEVVPVVEDLECAMFETTMDTLAAAGFEHYEISNYAQPGHRCRHNLVYWANEAYFGFGLGAARYVGGRREVNTRDLLTYLQKLDQGSSPTQQSEELTPEERARETAMLQVRRLEGIERQAFLEQTGFALDVIGQDSIARHVASGLLADDGAAIRLTRQGRLLADVVTRDFLA